MIDFKNGSVIKLAHADDHAYDRVISPLLIDGEDVIAAYKSVRDGVVFTEKRIFAINVQGITGMKVDCTSLPYSKIQAFSVETPGVLDLDGELALWFSGLGQVRFEFRGAKALRQICRVISEHVL